MKTTAEIRFCGDDCDDATVNLAVTTETCIRYAGTEVIRTSCHRCDGYSTLTYLARVISDAAHTELQHCDHGGEQTEKASHEVAVSIVMTAARKWCHAHAGPGIMWTVERQP